MSNDPNYEKQLHDLLVEAQTALDRVRNFAVLHGLQFSFHGLRRGPEDKGDWGNGGHWHELYEDLEDCSSVVKESVLDISDKWVSSGAWC